MRLFLLILLSPFFFTVANGQAGQLVREAETLLEAYEQQYNSGSRQKARLLLDEGITLLEGSELDTLTGVFYNLYAFYAFNEGRIDLALQKQLKAVHHFERGFGAAEPTAFAMHNAAFLFQRVSEHADSALHYFQGALAIYQALDRPLDVADEYRNIGLVHLSQNDYAAAQGSYLRALAVLNDIGEEEIGRMPSAEQILYAKTLAWLYLNLADLKLELDDIRQLRVYLQYSQDVLARFATEFPELETELKEGQARMHAYLGHYERSIHLYQQLSEAFLEQQTNDWLRIRLRVLQLYLDSDQYKEAIAVGEQILERQQQLLAAIPRRKIQLLRNLTNAYLKEGRVVAARHTLKMARAVLPEVGNAQEALFVEVLNAQILCAEQRFSEAQTIINKVLESNALPPSSALAEIQALKSNILFQLYKEKNVVALLDSSFYWAQNSWATLDKYELETFSYQFFGKNYRYPTECLLQVLFEQNRLQPSPDLQQRILDVLELSRGRSLKLGRQWQAVDSPQSQAYESARAIYLRLLKQRLVLESSEVQDERIYEVNDSLVAVGRHLDQLRASLRQDGKIALQSVQAAMESQGSLALLYFAGQNQWFVMAIAARQVILHQGAMTDSLQTVLHTFSAGVKNTTDRPAQLAASAFAAYQHLLAPVLQQSSGTIRRLLLSSDGAFSVIPWAALCTAPPTTDDFRQWPFLIKEYALAHLFSILDAIQPSRRNTTAETTMACFAPIYPERIDTTPRPKLAQLYRNGFWALPGAQAEAHQVAALYGAQADLFTSTDLAAEEFMQTSADYDLLHLAMHAVADPLHPDESYLLFPAANQSLEYVTALDLLALGLRAQLLVASACYAGEGRWQAGDGVLSLAYVLRQAGVESVLSNYWAAADEPTRDLMIHFHEQLLAGLPLDEALQKAQQRYLLNAPLAQAAHPFYWAGFHLQGNLQPITIADSGWPWSLVFASLAFLGILVYSVWRRRSAARS